MTREEAKELLPIIQAYAEGKTIQILGRDKWIDKPAPNFSLSTNYYRIKPEPKYRPFKSQEECWNEMMRHQPFGWVKNNAGNIFNIIAMINRNYTIKLNECYSGYPELLKDYKFMDDTPFGIMED